MELELKTLIEQGNATIAALRTEVEGLKSADVVATEKVGRIEADLAKSLSEKSALEARLNAMETAAARPGAFGAKSEAVDEAKSAFLDYVRNPTTEAKKMAFEQAARKAFESKSIDTVTGENGGYAVPSQIASAVVEVARNYSPIRRLSRVDTVSTPEYSVIVNKGGAKYRWGNQLTEREGTSGAKLAEVKPTFGILYADVTATHTSLQDMFFNTEAWIVREIAEAFAEGESEAFLKGNGVDQPTGLLHGTAIERVNSGDADDLGAVPFDTLAKLFFGIKGGYRQNGTWIMNSVTLSKLVTVRNDHGDYVFPQTLQAGIDARIFGREVAIDENMDDVEAGSTPILFGDLAKTYLIADRTSFWFQSNPFRTSGRIIFEAEKRVGGNVLIGDASRLLRIAV